MKPQNKDKWELSFTILMAKYRSPDDELKRLLKSIDFIRQQLKLERKKVIDKIEFYFKPSSNVPMEVVLPKNSYLVFNRKVWNKIKNSLK